MDMNNRRVSWKQINKLTVKISVDMVKEQWIPDYIVGIVRGGLIPAVTISHILQVPMHALKVSLRDGNSETNCWMPEDLLSGKKILIVDDINDSGNTISWIKQDWFNSVCGTISNEEWTALMQTNLKFAVLFDNLGSSETVDFYGTSIDKDADPRWLIFPWEEF